MIAASARSKNGGLTFALQALLDRHESYMSESEEERRRMAARIEQLGQERIILEAENVKVIHENEDLTHQLQGLHAQIVDSDAHIKSLMATLSSVQFENQRLMALASRTAELEAQISAMEISHPRLQDQRTATQADQKPALRVRKYAETRLRDSNDRVQKIQEEAGAGREKHVEIIRQMERGRAVEEEPKDADGRLKGAAAANTISKEKQGTNVVSHFVRDILQDNSNLQVAVVELGELLQMSNEEVQNLRELMLRHRSISSEHALQPASKRDQTEQSRPKPGSQEVHVHYHYHPKVKPKEKRPNFHRPAKRRVLISLSGNHSTGQTQNHSRAPDPLSKPDPGNNINRWSTQSSATQLSNISSLPSSTYSDPRISSIFDGIESGSHSSRPTTPESAYSASSPFQIEHPKPYTGSNTTTVTGGPEDEQRSKIVRRSENNRYPEATRRPQTRNDKAKPKQEISRPHVIEQAAVAMSKRPQPVPKPLITDHGLDGVHAVQSVDALDGSQFDRGLHRSNSQESLVSISGMDIHLPQRRNVRPCFLTRPSSTSEGPHPLNLSITFPSSQPLASIAEVNASFSNVLSPLNSVSASPISLLSVLAGGKSSGPGAKGFGRLFGGWARSGLGVNLVASSDELSTRVPGINQKGPVLGWKTMDKAPSEVHVKVLDEGLLKEALLE